MNSREVVRAHVQNTFADFEKKYGADYFHRHRVVDTARVNPGSFCTRTFRLKVHLLSFACDLTHMLIRFVHRACFRYDPAYSPQVDAASHLRGSKSTRTYIPCMYIYTHGEYPVLQSSMNPPSDSRRCLAQADFVYRL